MATPRKRRVTAEEPASVLAARQLAAEAVRRIGARRVPHRPHRAVPIRPLADILRVAT